MTTSIDRAPSGLGNSITKAVRAINVNSAFRGRTKKETPDGFNENVLANTVTP